MIVNKQQAEKSLRWRKLPPDRYPEAEAFLKNREKSCVTAAARFLEIGENGGHIWYLSKPGREIIALLLHCRHSLLPVFDRSPFIPAPRFLNRFLGKIHIHAVQGLKEDTERLEALMREQGYFATEKIDYDLMSLDGAPKPEALLAGPSGLVLRPPRSGDADSLFALQSAYEQEEVLPKNAVFNPASCRLNLERILLAERVLVAELDGLPVGKINTSAESFTRCQIGGVYVRPGCRGLGIATKMTAVFTQALLAEGKGVSLFVKKRNPPARAVYRKAGFSVLADYRISYF